jgi:membrane protein DedA with SNARE-associated domain
MLHFFMHAIERYGYAAVVGLVAIEGLGIPLPGETAVVTAAAFAAAGSLNVIGVAIAAALGTLLGGSGGYWLGRSQGRALLARHGHHVGLDAEKVARAERYFAEHGLKTVFFARFVAVLRILGGLLAGMAHMPFGRFTAVNAAGGVLWAATFTAVGYLFGRNMHRLQHDLGLASLILLGVVIAGFGVRALRRRMAGPVDGET